MRLNLKILFVDDHIGLRDGCIMMLKQKNPHLEILAASDSEQATTLLRENPDFDCAILDLNLDGENGLDLVSAVKKTNPKTAILIFSMFNDGIHIENAISKGIQGYVTKDASIDELNNAIITVSNNGNYYSKTSASVIQNLIKHGPDAIKSRHDEEMAYLFTNYKTLSKKEREVFLLLAEGKELAEIAQTTGKSEKTVINQRTAVYEKLDIKDRHDLIEKAKMLGAIL